MAVSETPVALADRLRSALRIPPGDGGDLAMTAALRGRHPADIAEAMEDLAHPEALAVFNWLDNIRAAEVLDELDPGLVRYLLENAPPGRISDLLDRLPMDDAAELVAEIAEETPDRAEEILAELETRAPEDAADVRELLSYGEKTAGRLMTDKFVRLSGELTVEEAFGVIRGADPEVETLNDLYVVRSSPDSQGETLVGVLTLRALVLARPNSRIADIMSRDPVAVTVDTDQEEVAQLIGKYDFNALPVLDRNGYLAGIVTVDDVVDILVEEQTEDVLKLGAVQGDETHYLSTQIRATVKQRIGWLLMLFVASMLTGGVSRYFEPLVAKVAALATFTPLLIGTGGNAGAQAVMTVTRAMALGEVRFSDWVRVLWRELRTGLLLGGLLSVVGFFVVLLLWREPPRFALVVSGSIISVVVWANLVGGLLPLFARRLGADPAVMSAPFITTLVDATGLLIYFTIARALLGI
jgi:Mg2+ transporter (mgtE)